MRHSTTNATFSNLLRWLRNKFSREVKMDVYVDGATTRCCYVLGNQEPVVVSFEKPVTNNVGEYMGLINALQALAKDGGNKNGKITIYSDSQVIVNQVNLRYTINHEHLRLLYQQVKSLIKEYDLDVELIWIPRDKNKAGWVLG